MKIPFIIVFLGLLIFSSHLFNALFSKTKIPNLLLLLIIGIIVDPILNLVPDGFFGEFGNVFTTITLIVILFESGTSLKFSQLKKGFLPAITITLINFFVAVGITAALTSIFLGLGKLSALFIGVVIGGTSASVVIPMVKQLKLGSAPQTILYLESALSDVLVLVIGLALLEGMKAGEIDLVSVAAKMSASFLFAAAFGIGGGILWSFMLKHVRSIKTSMFTTFAFVFVLYGLVEFFGFNGGIAALSFGIMLGNSKNINKSSSFKKIFQMSTVELSENEMDFFSEIVFILQTYFFVYIGMNIKFGNFYTYAVGFFLVVIIIILRPLSITLISKANDSLKEKVTLAIMTPKGLVAAVLASLPIQFGFPDAAIIQDIGYSVVFFSILIVSMLVIFMDKFTLYLIKGIRKKESNNFIPKDESSENSSES